MKIPQLSVFLENRPSALLEPLQTLAAANINMAGISLADTEDFGILRILLKDWDGRFLLGNTALARLYGTTPEQLVGKDDGAFNPNREQVDFYLENVRAVMRTGKPKR